VSKAGRITSLTAQQTVWRTYIQSST